MKTKIYYLRDKKHFPVVTVCIGKHGNYYYRGMSVCSYKDIVKKATGRAIAEGRMTQAFVRKVSSQCATPKRIRRDPNLKYYFIYEFNDGKKIGGHIKTSEYHAKATAHEKELLRAKPRGAKSRTVSKSKSKKTAKK